MSRTYCSYRKKAQGCLFISSAMSKYSEKLMSLSNWSLPENFSAGAFIFKFTVYRNVRNQFVLFISYLLCVILLWQSKWTKVLGISLGTSKKNTYLSTIYGFLNQKIVIRRRILEMDVSGWQRSWKKFFKLEKTSHV